MSILGMPHLAVRPQITYTNGPSGGPMAKAKTADEDTRTQRQKFIDAAREHGADESPEGYRSVMRKIATAPTKQVKKAAKKRKR